MRARLSILVLLILLPPTGQGADPLRTTRLLLDAGLLLEADRAQAIFVAALVEAGLPDDGDPSMTTAVRTAFPASRVRERWIRLLSEQLSATELAAAEDFYRSVPGQAFTQALRAAPDAVVPNPPADLQAAVHAMEAPARAAVLRVRTGGFAIWLAEREKGHESKLLEDAWRDALERYGRATRTAEIAALQRIAPVHALGFADFAMSAAGQRFHGKLTAALDLALAELAREHKGTVQRALIRRAGAQSPG